MSLRTRSDARRAWVAACLTLVGAALVGCSAGATRDAPIVTGPAPREAVRRDPIVAVARSVAAVGHGDLVERLGRSPMRTFRYLASPFVEATCDRFGAHAGALPSVNLHGDAHVEQYALAEDGRGLADFDAATTGPYVVDLVRFAASLHVASSMRGFSREGADASVAAFLRGYRAGLADPNGTAPEPHVVQHLRARFAPDAKTWLDRVEGFMSPLDPRMQSKVEAAYAPFVQAMLAQNADLDAGFFRIRRLGNLEMGVGSVHERKFLARVAGPTDAPEDDVIYEVKEVARIEPGTCVVGDPERDPMRVIRGQERLSGVHQRFLGFVHIEGHAFYVHTWRVNYTELEVTDLETAGELAEVAYDVGVQLGHGHPQGLDAPAGGSLARAVAASLDELEPEVVSTSRALAASSLEAWRVLDVAARPGAASR